MRDLGGNFVRTSHYPNDMRFLDLCDELGFYVWEESHSRNIDFNHPKFHEQITGSTREMIEWHYNHPAIVMWGSLNECQSETPEGHEVYRHVLGLIKQLDPDRPVTSASNRYQRDVTLEYVDIVSWNIYTGWYGRDLEGVGPFLDELLAWQDTTAAANAKGKPVIISEFGAGAIYGYRDPARPKWSEEYQSDLLEASLEVYLNHPAVMGVAIWQFCDIRVSEGWWYSRPRTMNNKGVVDQFRRPKLSYPVVRTKFMEARQRWDGK
jgi:beta-glucuronidase